MPFRFPIYRQIHLRERQIIERLYVQGYTPGKIARQVFRSRSTITREIQRNGYPDNNGQWQYNAKIAQRFCRHRQRRIGSIRGANKLHKREPSANYVHTTPLLPDFRIRIHRGFHIDLKRWMRKYKLSRWHENYFGKAWRQSNNWLRNRCYSWEEMGRRLKKTSYCPSTFYSRRLARLRRFFRRKYRKKYEERALNRHTVNSFSRCRKPIITDKKQLHILLESCIFSKERLIKQLLTNSTPLHCAPTQRPDSTTMLRIGLNRRFFKIPSLG